MSSVGLRPPQFSEDLAWLPGWLQHLSSEESTEPTKSQISTKQAVKDLVFSQENGKDDNALSREEGRYNSCHLILSGEDSSPVSFSPSSENVLHFSLRLSSDVDSVFCPTQSLSASHDVLASSKATSVQLVETSVKSRENRHSMMECDAPEQNLLPPSISETAKDDCSGSPSDKTHSVRLHKEQLKVKSVEGSDISDAVELSIAASEALVIHDLVKMGSVLETIPTEALLEVALRVKQARLEGLEDGFHSSNEESDWSDSLSNLNDFAMADAYGDVGLGNGVFSEKNHCSSALLQEKDIVAENHYGFENEVSGTALRSHFVNFNENYAKEELGVNKEVEMQLKPDSPLESLRHEKQMDSYDPSLGSNSPILSENGLPIVHQTIENNSNSNILAINQTIGLPMADMTSDKPHNSVNSSLDGAGNLRKENWETFMVPRKFRSRWLGGWTCKESGSPSPECIPNFFIRETSFLSESADIVPDEASFVKKHNSQCGIGSQSSIPFEGLHSKADESILHSQDVVICSSLSLVDPLCSVVPCSIGSEHANSKSQSDKNNDTEKFVPDTPEFGVDNVQKTSDQNIAVDYKNGEDVPFSVTEKVAQLPEKLNTVKQASRKQLNSLKSYSMIEPNQSFNVQCNWAMLPTDQSIVGAVSSDQSSKGLSASKCAYGNRNEVNHENSVNHKSITEITYEKRRDYTEAVHRSDVLSEPSQQRNSPLILNHRARRLVGPKTVVSNINADKHLTQHVVPETVVQHQQNNNLHQLQPECSKFHDGPGVRKQVRFTVADEQLHQKNCLLKSASTYQNCSSVKGKKRKASKLLTNLQPPMKHSLTNYYRRAGKKLIFQGLEFLLTGLSSQKERDLETLVRNSGGVVLPDIPSPPNSRGKRSSTSSQLQLPIILCMRKLQTAKFLYGCAVGALILKVDWLTDCIAGGTILQPEEYMILRSRNDMKGIRIGKEFHLRNQESIFERVGIMLHGKHSFCTKLARIIKHGGGQVFKTLQWLVRSIDGRISIAAIVAEDKTTVSRHLKHCASEKEIPVMPSSWIIKSLYSGKLLPFTEESCKSQLPITKVPEVPISLDMSEEI
ncbi:hypothetical protein L6164_023182 [Bauhinia variegata]|uniref:Uncharacterized protein n=1 Tax=Bauhinia variegata TaxID=167791 RepID=A0ACB9MHW8_BAUVA|nr:hypothetical protein L6164_023182 [Bauhinia variegata]